MNEPRDREVLVIEDDKLLRQSIAEALEHEGFRVNQASHGGEALAALRDPEHPLPSLVLLDLMLPVVDGWEVREAMLADARLARIPVVVTSALREKGLTTGALRASGYLQKPFRLDSLLELASELCSAA